MNLSRVESYKQRWMFRSLFIGLFVAFAFVGHHHQTFQRQNDDEVSLEVYNDEGELWQLRYLPDHLQNVDQSNPELIREIRDRWIIPPSLSEYNLEATKKHYSQKGQSELVDEILHQRKNGFFIDSGASDGERFSNSLFFERERNWGGVLVEPNLNFFRALLRKQRKAYKINACLSTTRTPMVVSFSNAKEFGGITKHIEPTRRNFQRMFEHVQRTQCLPLYSILRALDLPHVDYWSLDIEGSEPHVLDTLPWRQTDIEVINVEATTDDKDTQIDDILQLNGYSRVNQSLKHEIIYRKKTNFKSKVRG